VNKSQGALHTFNPRWYKSDEAPWRGDDHDRASFLPTVPSRELAGEPLLRVVRHSTN
jgi:hypothetical protein